MKFYDFLLNLIKKRLKLPEISIKSGIDHTKTHN